MHHCVLKYFPNWVSYICYLSNTLSACLWSDKIGLNVVLHTWFQLVIQYVRWGIIIVFMYSFATGVVKQFLIYLKFARLYLVICTTFLTWCLNDRVESRIMPRYLNCVTVWMTSPDTQTLGSQWDTVLLLLKNIQTVFLTLRFSCEQVSHYVHVPLCRWAWQQLGL